MAGTYKPKEENVKKLKLFLTKLTKDERDKLGQRC